MALADIIRRIESDAEAEVAAVIGAAEARVADVGESARAQAREHREAVLAAAEQEAERESARLLATAKLAARDEALAARRALIDEALRATVEALARLPIENYAALLAARIAPAVRGGEVIRFGSEDGQASPLVVEAVSRIAPDVTLAVASAPAPFARGALIEGDRVRLELSLEAIVEERRDQLELVLAESMFGTEA